MSDRDYFLVSGGSGGIGAAVCAGLSEKGFPSLVGYVGNPDAAARVAAQAGGISLALDLTSGSSIQQAVDFIADSKLSLAGVILAASPPPLLCSFGQIDGQELEHQLQVNVKGPQLLLAALVRQCLRKKKWGSVVGVLTRAMGQGIGSASPGMGSYVIAKYGMEGMLAALAGDYPWLRVASVSPGFTTTSMLTVFDDRYLELQRQKERFNTPEEVAQTIIEEALGHE